MLTLQIIYISINSTMQYNYTPGRCHMGDGRRRTDIPPPLTLKSWETSYVLAPPFLPILKYFRFNFSKAY